MSLGNLLGRPGIIRLSVVRFFESLMKQNPGK
jgi:hypothetical protein